MCSEKASNSRIHSILMLFVLVNIIGDIANIIIWFSYPVSQGSLVGNSELSGGYIAQIAGADAALASGTIILAVVATIYLVAWFGLRRCRIWAPLLVIAISIANRVMAVLLFEVNAAFALWGLWTAILVVAAIVDYRQTSTTK